MYLIMDIVSVNFIAENKLDPVGLEVKDNTIVNEDIKKRFGPDFLTITNIHYQKRNGFKRHKMATRVFETCAQRNYGSTDCVVMKYIKESNPDELAEYDTSADIKHEP